MAGSRRLNQYGGRLSAEEIAEGMNAALENAVRLRADAEVLLDGGRYASAAALAVLAVEEAGKVAVLRQLATAATDKERAAFWKQFRTHTAKNSQVFFLDRVAGGARTLEAFRPLFEPASELPALAEHVKQLALYTDCLGRRHWSKPEAVISMELARSMVRAAQVVACGKVITPREIELWQHHIGPVRNAPMPTMKAALVAWHDAMVAEGLELPDRAGAMASFAYGLGKPKRASQDE